MSLTIPFSGHRARARHRGKSGLQLRRELAAAEVKIASLIAGIDQISAERNTAEKRADDTQLALDTAGKEIRQLEEAVELRDLRIADLERRLDIGVKAEHVVAKTQEIDPDEVRRICAQSAAGINPVPAITPVMPLHESPLANPANVPAAIPNGR